MLGMEHRRTFILALIPLVMLTTACGSSGNMSRAQSATSRPSPSQAASTPPASAAPEEFTSKRYGLQVTLTKGWTEQDAQSAWNGKQLEGLSSADFADFTSPAGDRTLVAAAAPVAKGISLSAWQAAMVRAAPDACTDSRSPRRTTLGGEPALTWTATCSDGFDVTKLAARHGTRGYMVFLASASGNDSAVNRGVFESIRRSFRFTG